MFKLIKRAFGYGDETEIEDVQSEEASEQPNAPAAQIVDVEVTNEQIVSIFDKVVEIFNSSLPDFLAQSVDPQKQKQLLYDSLDDSIKSHLANLKDMVKGQCEAVWSQEREKLQAESAELRKKAQELEGKKAELNDQQLSANRQKRALSERVKDLEAQVLTLEAEKEQFEIESKCMINKTKAAAVLESELEELRAQYNELRLSKLNSADAPDQAPDPTILQELEALKAENAKLKECSSDLVAENTKLQQSAADLVAENAKLQQSSADLVAENAKLKESVDELAAEHENSASKEELEAIQKQIAMFEDVKKKMDARIEKLKDSLKLSKEENESLRMTIQNNLLLHAQQQQSMREQIEALKSSQNVSYHIEDLIEKKTTPMQAADVDDLLSGTDWLVSSPPKEASMRVPDEDFGYQPPAKKNRSFQNDSQLSLFD